MEEDRGKETWFKERTEGVGGLAFRCIVQYVYAPKRGVQRR